jgi:hypothetical protein
MNGEFELDISLWCIVAMLLLLDVDDGSEPGILETISFAKWITQNFSHSHALHYVSQDITQIDNTLERKWKEGQIKWPIKGFPKKQQVK